MKYDKSEPERIKEVIELSKQFQELNIKTVEIKDKFLKAISSLNTTDIVTVNKILIQKNKEKLLCHLQKQKQV